MKTTLGRMLVTAAVISSFAAAKGATIDGPAEAMRVRATTYVDGPRTPEGDIDYAAAFNGLYGRGTTPDANACVALRRVLGPREIDERDAAGYYAALGIEPLPARGDYFVDYRRFRHESVREYPRLSNSATEYETIRRRTWRRNEFACAADWLDSQAAALAKVERAVERPDFYNPVGPHLSDAPGLEGHRQLAEALIARSMLLAGEQKLVAALADLSTCRRLARLTARGPNVEWYQEAAIIELDAIDAEAAILGQSSAGAELFERRLDELRTLSPFPAPTAQFEWFERFAALDLLQGLARGDESSLLLYAQITADESHRRLNGIFANFDYAPARRYVNDTVDQIAEAGQAANPAARRKRLTEIGDRLSADLDAEPTDGAAIGRRVAGACLSAAPAAYLLHDRLLQAAAQLRPAYRLAAYRARNGRFPASLAELAAPSDETTDRFGGGSLVYRPEADGVLLYGVGENGVDDGGRNYRDDGESGADDLRIRLTATGTVGR